MTLIERLNTIQQDYEFNDNQLSAKIGLTAEELRTFRENRLRDQHKLALIESFCSKLEANVYPTKLLSNMHKLLERTFKENTITVIGSVSGAGKTYALEMYCAETPDAVYIEIPELITPRYLLILISKKLGLPYLGLTLFQMYESIKAYLLQDNKLFAFDEADRLNKKMFEILRDLWHDGKGNCAIAFVGDENLMQRIKRGDGLHQNLIRLMRRVKYVEIFDPIHKDDVQVVFKNVLGSHRISDKAMELVYDKFKGLGGLGSIIDLADYIRRLSQKSGDKPNNEMVSEAIKRLKQKF